MRFNGKKVRCSDITYSNSLDVSGLSVSDMSEIDFSFYKEDSLCNARQSG